MDTLVASYKINAIIKQLNIFVGSLYDKNVLIVINIHNFIIFGVLTAFFIILFPDL